MIESAVSSPTCRAITSRKPNSSLELPCPTDGSVVIVLSPFSYLDSSGLLRRIQAVGYVERYARQQLQPLHGPFAGPVPRARPGGRAAQAAVRVPLLLR